MTRSDAVKWLNSKVGQHLDYDGKYGQQCVDFFRYYEAYLTGKNSYSITPGVKGAKDLWNLTYKDFTKVKNDTSKVNQLPPPGAILIYNSKWGAGNGHVEVVLSATTSKLYVIGENEHNDPKEGVVKVTRTWSSVVSGLIGWLDFKNFKEAPSAPKPTPKPTPKTPAPKPTPTPPTKAPAPAPKPPVQKPEPPVVAPEPEPPVTPPVVPPAVETPSTPVKTAPKAEKVNFVNLLLTALLDILKAIFKRS